jgi:two-component system, chemotaxis family, CheB/CheR fusion protein
MPETAIDPREQFLDDVSHELRMPLTALKGQIQLMQRRLRRELAHEEDLVDLGKMIYHVERLNHQLDVFLAATHIQQNRYMILPAPCDIVAVVRHLVSIYAAGTSLHTVRFESSLSEFTGEWDRRRIEEATSAFLTNAIKYSRGGEVLVRVERRDDVAIVEVRDQGIGVPARERSSIFHAYTTGSRAESVGIGLGLYVAEQAIKRQHGRIGVRSAGRGQGSVFWFELPLLPPRTPRRGTNRTRQPRKLKQADGQTLSTPETFTHTVMDM